MIDFDIASKEFFIKENFCASNFFKNLCNTAVVEHFFISSIVLSAVITPYHSIVSSFYQNTDTERFKQNRRLLQKNVSLIELPEKLLLQLGELYAQLQGNVVIGTIIGAEEYQLPIKKFRNFGEMVSSVKELWSCIFTENFLSFCSQKQIKIEHISIEISVQKWDDVDSIYRMSFDGGIRIQDINKNDMSLEFVEMVLSNIRREFLANVMFLDFIKTSNKKIIFFRKINKSRLIKDNKKILFDFKNKEFARICVVGIVCYNHSILMLKQSDDNMLWRPPCGGVHKNEDCVDALRREIKEDTNLDVNVILPVNIWKNSHGIDNTTLSITYVCEAFSKDVKISAEYSKFLWLSDIDNTTLQTQFDISEWKNYISLSKFYKNTQYSQLPI
jgi:ADP-ribose pyrophosphatase YjhB (NUDIX family)